MSFNWAGFMRDKCDWMRDDTHTVKSGTDFLVLGYPGTAFYKFIAFFLVPEDMPRFVVESRLVKCAPKWIFIDEYDGRIVVSRMDTWRSESAVLDWVNALDKAMSEKALREQLKVMHDEIEEEYGMKLGMYYALKVHVDYQFGTVAIFQGMLRYLREQSRDFKKPPTTRALALDEVDTEILLRKLQAIYGYDKDGAQAHLKNYGLLECVMQALIHQKEVQQELTPMDDEDDDDA